MQLRLLAVLASAFVLTATPALARRPARIDYTRSADAEACPDESGLRSAVATRLGYDPFEENASPLVTASVTRPSGYEASIQFRDEHGRAQGEKKLTSSAGDCTELASAMALTISILLDPRALMGRPEPPAPPPPPDPHDSPFEPERPPSPPPSPAPPARESVLVRVGAEALASVGAAPGPAMGVVGFIGVGRGVLSIDLEARADFPASAMRSDGTGVRSSLLVGTVAPCGHFGIAALCALASAGALHGEGLNVGTPERHATFYAAAGARAGIEIALARALLARVHADALLPLTRTTLKNRGVEYWTSPPVAGVLALGLMGHF